MPHRNEGHDPLFDELRDAVRAADTARIVDEGPVEIEGYEVLEEIGRGGQGVVHRARALDDGRIRAIKVLRHGAQSSTRERIRLEREIEIVSALDHPGVVRVIEGGVTDGRPFSVMEHVDGHQLRDWCSSHPHTEDRLGICEQIVAAVAHAHSRGVIHRDLKPGNIIVDSEGRARILDFGLAAVLDERRHDERATWTGQFLGTLRYAAPEQVEHTRGPVSTATDVYALGVLFWEVLTDRAPYGDEADDLHRLVRHVVETQPAWPRVDGRPAHRDLAAWLLKSLHKNPARRYGSAREMHEDLVRYRTGRPILARADRTLRAMRRTVLRHRIVAAVLVVAVSLGSVIVWQQVQARRIAEDRRESTREVATLIEALLLEGGSGGMGDEIDLPSVLQSAADLIERRFADVPDARAALEMAIGATYRKLFDYDRAAHHLERALVRLRESSPDDPDTRARCLRMLGEALARQSKGEAVPFLEEAVALYEEHRGDDHPDTARSRRDLADALSGRYPPRPDDRIDDLFRRALETFVAQEGEDGLETAYTRVLHAGHHRRQGRAGGSELVEKAMASVRRYRGPADGRVLFILDRYLGLLQQGDRLDEADRIHERVLAMTRELYGDDVRSVVLRRMASFRSLRGEIGEAERLSREALAVQLESWVEKRPEERTLLATMARRTRDRTDDDVLPEAFAELRELEGVGTWELANYANRLARLTLHRGARDVAERLARVALTFRCRLFGNDCPVRLDSHAVLARALIAGERFAEAKAVLDVAMEVVTRLELEPRRTEELHELMETCRRKLP